MKEIPIHKDKLGSVLSVGDYVAFTYYKRLQLGVVHKLLPKVLAVKLCNNNSWSIRKYAKDTIKIEGPGLIWYLLKK